MKVKHTLVFWVYLMSTSWIPDPSLNIKLLAINYLILRLHFITMFYNQDHQVLLLKSLIMKNVYMPKRNEKDLCNEVIVMNGVRNE